MTINRQIHIHFIAIGGAAMHNLAIALHKKGYRVTGSDDEIFDPSKSRLARYDLLPKTMGWDVENIRVKPDVIILGMHARKDNPELIAAQKAGLKIYSYPEYIYEQTKNKTRVVIGGSHGKTTVTSMILHVLKNLGKKIDYLVGSQIEGFETMAGLDENAEIAILEGDEYLSSPIDLRPKFHLYQPNIAVITGIAWDHINVFPTFENYVDQFRIFTEQIVPGGTLIYYEKDTELQKIIHSIQNKITCIPYLEHEHKVINNQTFLTVGNEHVPLLIFGKHNMQNLQSAMLVCHQLGIDEKDFYASIATFTGAGKRLQHIASKGENHLYLDFAHSPSKLKATIEAVKEQYPDHTLVACMELHTFSSLSQDFLTQYEGSMDSADVAIVYYNPKTIEHKQLKMISKQDVASAFKKENLTVCTEMKIISTILGEQKNAKKIFLLMSSGNFSGLNLNELTKFL